MKWLLIVFLFSFAILAALRSWYFFDKRSRASIWRKLAKSECEAPAEFSLELVSELPEPARRFFSATIAVGTPLHTVVELQMHGEFSLGTQDDPNYQPMKACQLLAAPEGFVWQVEAGSRPMRISGSDAAFPGGSWTRFWLFGLLPVARAGGNPDHALSALGRYMGEAIFWSPASVLPSSNVRWEGLGADSARVTIQHDGQTQAYDLTVDAEGLPVQIKFQRWSNQNAAGLFSYQPFGGYLSDFRRFDGYLLPTTVQAGNHFDSDEYYPFFKATVEKVRFVRSSTLESTLEPRCPAD